MPRRISVDQLVRTNVMSHDRARSDETTLPEPDAANDGCISADSDSFFNPRLDRNPVRVAATRSEIVGENRIWTKKHIISHVHVLPDADSILDGHIISDGDAALDKSMIADIAMRPDTDVLQHMSKRPDARTFANRVRFDQRFLVDEWWFHLILILQPSTERMTTTASYSSATTRETSTSLHKPQPEQR